MRPPRTNQEQQMFEGIVYRRDVRSIPRPIILHIVTVNLRTPGIKLLATPGKPTMPVVTPGKPSVPGIGELRARTTSDFVTEFKLQLAVNANFHYPSRDNGPWDYYPHAGDLVNVLGQAISNGLGYASAIAAWPALCFSTPKQRVQIPDSGKCPADSDQAVAGSAILVRRGMPVPVPKDAADNDGLYPRTVAAIDKQGQKLWLIVVDGRQPFYSEGVTLAEMTQILLKLGVYTAVNLDGGGSTTLVVATPNGPKLLNSPVFNRIPMLQRPVANHLGIYAYPKR